MRCVRTTSRRPMSGVPWFPARSQRSDELPHRARTEPGGTGLSPYKTAERQPARVLPHVGSRPPAHAACLTRGRSRKRRARGCAGCARFELLRPGNAPVCDEHTRERLPAAPLKSGQGLFGSLGPPLRRFVRNEPSSRTSVHAAASCSPGLSRTTLHSRRGSFAAMHALGTVLLTKPDAGASPDPQCSDPTSVRKDRPSRFRASEERIAVGVFTDTVRAPGSLTASWVVRRSCEPVTLASDCCERLP